MSLIPVKTPKLIKRIFSAYTWDFSLSIEKNIYLTFDDGPIPEVTEYVLDQLHEFNAKATFFCIGDNIRKYPEIFKKVIAGGHSIGNHTMTHLKAYKSSKSQYINDVKHCEEHIRDHIVDTEYRQLFRPPHGQISYSKLRALQKMGYTIILWDVLGKDWETFTTSSPTEQYIISNTVPGSIIVLHDSIKAYRNMSEALPKILRYFSENGYSFKKI